MFNLYLKNKVYEITDKEREGLENAIFDSNNKISAFRVSRLRLAFTLYDFIRMEECEENRYVLNLEPLFNELIKENSTVFLDPIYDCKGLVLSSIDSTSYGGAVSFIGAKPETAGIFIFKVLRDSYLLDNNLSSVIFKKGLLYNEDGTVRDRQPQSGYIKPFPFTREHLSKYSEFIVPYETHLDNKREKMLLENKSLTV